MGFVYFAYSQNDDSVKIGYTKNNVRNRLKALNTGNSSKLILLGYINGDKEVESYLHNKFSKYKKHYNLEWFYFNDEIREYINSVNLLDYYVERIDGKVYCLNKMKNF